MKKDRAVEEHCPYCKRHCSLNNPHCKKGATLAEEKKKEIKKSIESKKTKEEIKFREDIKSSEEKTEENKKPKVEIKSEKAKKWEEDTKSKEVKKSKEDIKFKEAKKPKEGKKSIKAKEHKEFKLLIEEKKLKEELTENSLLVMKNDYKEIPTTTDAEDERSVVTYIEEWSPTQEETRLLQLFQKCYDLLPHEKIEKQSSKKGKIYFLNLLSETGALTQKELKDYTELSSADLTKLLLKLQNKGYTNWIQVDQEDKKVSLTEIGLKLAKEIKKEKIKDRSNPFSALDNEEKEYLEHILKKLYIEWNHELYNGQNEAKSI